MKQIIFALLTTQILGHRFAVNFDEYNESETDQTAHALIESEKQLGVKMGTPLITERAKRIEKNNAVDYMGSLEFRNFQREESAEAQETADSIAEAKQEIKQQEQAERAHSQQVAAQQIKQAKESKEQQKQAEWKKAQEEAVLENASLLQLMHSRF